jgi:hypothetical protein
MTGLSAIGRLTGGGLSKPKVRIPGHDLAGRIETVGGNVTRFRRAPTKSRFVLICPMTSHRGPGLATALVQAGSQIQRQAGSGVWWRPRLCRGPGVGDGRKVGEQVRCLGWSQRLSLAKDVRPDGIQDDGSAGTGSTVVMGR